MCDIAVESQSLTFNCLQELEIEKGKYRELMKKYQMGSQETEEKVTMLFKFSELCNSSTIKSFELSVPNISFHYFGFHYKYHFLFVLEVLAKLLIEAREW